MNRFVSQKMLATGAYQSPCRIRESIRISPGDVVIRLPIKSFRGVLSSVPIGTQALHIFVGVCIGPNFLTNSAHSKNRIVFLLRGALPGAIFPLIPVEKVVVFQWQFLSLRNHLALPGGMRDI